MGSVWKLLLPLCSVVLVAARMFPYNAQTPHRHHSHHHHGLHCSQDSTPIPTAGLEELVQSTTNNPLSEKSTEIPTTTATAATTATATPEPSPQLKGCGFRNVQEINITSLAKPTNDEATFGEFPWVVAVIDNNNIYVGMGVLIHPRVVMTIAHSVTGFNPGELKTRAGKWNILSNVEPLKGQDRVVDHIRIHDDFVNNAERPANDIALLWLALPFELADHINVICLPEQDEVSDNFKDCVSNGWGQKSFASDSGITPILKLVDLDIVPTTTCGQQLQTLRGSEISLHESIVCAGRQGQDTCYGDGGAPLACPVGRNRYKLTGLVVGGMKCGVAPGLYTKVSSFRKWVDDTMTEWGYSTTGYDYNGLTFRFNVV